MTGGSGGYTWLKTSGTLPPGLTLSFNGSTATLSGTPTKTGKSSFTLKVTDSSGTSVTRTFTVNIRR